MPALPLGVSPRDGLFALGIGLLNAAAFPPPAAKAGRRPVAVAGTDGTVRVYELNEDLLKKDALNLLATPKH